MLSAHALVRTRQRAIPKLLVDWLIDFGAETSTNGGCTVRFFDRRAKRRLEHAVGREAVRRFKDKLSCYLVERDGKVITVGHRYQRIHNG